METGPVKFNLFRENGISGLRRLSLKFVLTG